MNWNKEVTPDKETVWLRAEEMVDLFERDRSVIQRHIKNILKENELEQTSTCAKFAQVKNEGNRAVERTFNYYNLDMIISVGYRVKSQRGAFRKWATSKVPKFLSLFYILRSLTYTCSIYLAIFSSYLVALFSLYF